MDTIPGAMDTYMDTKPAFRIFPFNGTIGEGNHAGATIQTPSKSDGHLSLFIERVKGYWTGINAESVLTSVTDLLSSRMWVSLSFLKASIASFSLIFIEGDPRS
jgi:hypothetical protein